MRHYHGGGAAEWLRVLAESHAFGAAILEASLKKTARHEACTRRGRAGQGRARVRAKAVPPRKAGPTSRRHHARESHATATLFARASPPRMRVALFSVSCPPYAVGMRVDLPEARA